MPRPPSRQPVPQTGALTGLRHPPAEPYPMGIGVRWQPPLRVSGDPESRMQAGQGVVACSSSAGVPGRGRRGAGGGEEKLRIAR